MSQRANFIDESLERVESAYQNVEDEIQKFQKKIQNRSDEFSKRTEKQLKRFGKELRKNEVVKRAGSLRDDVSRELEKVSDEFDKQGKRLEKSFESGLQSILGFLQIASRDEMAKLDKKLNKIGRRLTALDKSLNEKQAAAE